MAMGKDSGFVAAAKKQRINIEARPWNCLQEVV